MTPPVALAAPLTTRWPTSSAVQLIPWIWPRGICGRHPSMSSISWQGSHSSATCPRCRSILIPFLHNLHFCCWPPPLWPPAGPHHPYLTLHSTSSHLCSGGHLPPSANQHQHHLPFLPPYLPVTPYLFNTFSFPPCQPPR